MTDHETKLGPHRPPILFSGCVLLFWGIFTGHYIIGSVLALLIESHRLNSSRWELSDGLLGRLWQFCFIMFFIMLSVGMFRVGPLDVIYLCLEWLPVLLFPMALAQVYATRDSIPVSVFSLLARYIHRAEHPAGGKPRERRAVNIEYIYVFVVLLSASGANRAGVVFYVAAAVLLGWSLWKNVNRSKMNPVVWAACFLLVAATGYVGQIWLHRLHVFIENSTFFLNIAENDPDMSMASTRIGSVGELKGSPRIVWRVRHESGVVPGYLRSGAYNVYRGETWFFRNFRDFDDIRKVEDQDSVNWEIRQVPESKGYSRLVMLGRGSRDMTFLTLPGTPYALNGLNAVRVQRNALGVVQVTDAPRTLRFGVDYDVLLHGDTPPGEDDLSIPDKEMPVLTRIIDSLDLADAEPDVVLNSLSGFFTDNFRYSTYLTIKDDKIGIYATALQDFLEKTRVGHCEYFATATVLLLRQAGIPARYVVGYSVTEYSRRRKEYLVRGLHGHAWAQAWIDGQWQYVDNTPASWTGIEEEALSFMQPVSDWFNNLPYAFGLWRSTPAGRKVTSAFKWGSLPVLMFYLWFRLFRNQRSRRVKKKKAESIAEEVVLHGLDSEAYAIERRLAELGEERPVGMPFRKWWRRTAVRYPADIAGDVGTIIDLHYRYRFDPAGMGAGDRQRLRKLVAECIENLGRSPENA